MTDSPAARRLQRDILTALSESLRAETHVLVGYPDLLWQQFYNRLQWSGDTVRQVLAPELERRTAAGVVPWILLRNRRSQVRRPLMTYRQFSGIPLPGVSDAYTIRARIVDCAMSPDGSWVLSASELGIVKRWSAMTGRELMVCEIREQALMSPTVGCAMDAAGTQFVSVGTTGTIMLWDAPTGVLRRPIDRGRGFSTAVLTRAAALHPDGSLVAVTIDEELALYEVASGRIKAMLSGSRGYISCCAFSRDGAHVVAGDWAGFLTIWDVASGQIGHSMQTRRFTPQISACDFGPDGTWVASVTSTGEIDIWDVDAGALREGTGEHGGALGPYCLAIAPSGEFLATGGPDRTLRIWDVASGRLLNEFTGHDAGITACTFSPDGERLVSGDAEGTLHVWNTDSTSAAPDLPEEHRQHSKKVNTCAIALDGSIYVTGSADRTAKVWDMVAGREIRELGPDAGYLGVTAVAISPDGSLIATGDGDAVLGIWETATGECVATHGKESRPGVINACVFSPNGQLLAASQDYDLKMYDGSKRWDVRYTCGRSVDETFICAFTPDGTQVIVGGKRLEVCNSRSGALVAELPTGGSYHYKTGAVSPDGRYFAAAAADNSGFQRQLTVWNLETRQVMFTVPPRQPIWACPFTPDSQAIVVAYDDGLFCFLNPSTGAERSHLRLPERITCLALHPLLPLAIAGSPSGMTHLMEFAGTTYGPIIVTATDTQSGPEVRCSKCRRSVPLNKSQLNTIVRCPHLDCTCIMRVNAFVIGMEPQKDEGRSTVQSEQAKMKGATPSGSHHAWWPFGKRRR